MAPRKKALIKFHKEIYPGSAIKAAAAGYADFADVRVSVAGNYYKVVLTPKEGSADLLADEFANCALFNSL